MALLARVKAPPPGDDDEVGADARARRDDDPEVAEVFRALRGSGVDVVTVGQYLRPSAWNLPVVEYATPERFERLRDGRRGTRLPHVFSGPFVRSSYRAEEFLEGD